MEQLLQIPFATNWNITAKITEVELESLLADLQLKYNGWLIELRAKYPIRTFLTRKEYLANATPTEKLQAEIDEIQLSLWHRLIGMRSKKYSTKDTANTTMFLLLLKTHPSKNVKEKEYLKFK